MVILLSCQRSSFILKASGSGPKNCRRSLLAVPGSLWGPGEVLEGVFRESWDLLSGLALEGWKQPEPLAVAARLSLTGFFHPYPLPESFSSFFLGGFGGE